VWTLWVGLGSRLTIALVGVFELGLEAIALEQIAAIARRVGGRWNYRHLDGYLGVYLDVYLGGHLCAWTG